MRKRTGIILACVVVLLFAVAVVYAGIGKHYGTHFFEFTTINGIDVSDLTAAEAEALIAAQAEDYQVKVTTREGAEEEISGDAIGYRFVSGGEVESFLKEQNGFAWLPAYLKGGTSYIMEASVTYDKELLAQAVKNLNCMREDQTMAPSDARVEKQENTYVIVPEVEGNRLDEEKVIKALTQAVDSGETAVDLEASSCYLEPQIRSGDGSLRAEAAVMNRYSSITVTYQMGGGITEVLDSDTVASWFTLNENKQPIFDREKVAEWVNQLADKYDTIGTWQPFTTSNGETVYVEARTYGWQLDRDTETEELYQLLGAGDSAERSPVYLESAGTRGENDIGSTYVEIDYTNQRMWYYKDGALLVETPVVTGNVSAGMESPEGIFCLVGKEQNATLTGEGYSTPVDYWMPFYGGVGIHDADSWRTAYGGDIYQWSGSHGCINTPTAQAAVIYQNIEVGTPIICYKSEINYGYSQVGSSGGTSGASDGVIDISDSIIDISGGTSGTDGGSGSTSGTGGASGNASGAGASSGGSDDIVILDGGVTDIQLPQSQDPEDWADESLYYGEDLHDIVIE